MIILYTTHCPKCKIIETKLTKKGIPFEINDNVDEMIKLGFKFAPMLYVNGEYLDFAKANNWINQQGGNQ